MVENRPASFAVVWMVRLLLATLFFFGAEVLLWTNPLQHSLPEWGLRIIGYLALSTLTLDFATRYRIREVYDVLVLMGIYGLCVGLLLQPQISLVDFPRTLVTRVMGAQALIGAEMFGLFLVLTGGDNARYRRLMLGFSLWLGFYWGVWVHWSPILTERFNEEVSFSTLFASTGVVIALAFGLFVYVSRRGETLLQVNFKQSPLGLGVTLIVLISLFLVRLAENAINLDALPTAAILLVLCYAILWFRRADKGKTLLDAHFPTRPLGWVWIAIASAIFGVAAIFSYNIPLTTLFGFSQLSVMELAFALGGLVWLPVVAAMLSVRAIDKQAQKLEN